MSPNSPSIPRYLSPPSDFALYPLLPCRPPKPHTHPSPWPRYAAPAGRHPWPCLHHACRACVRASRLPNACPAFLKLHLGCARWKIGVPASIHCAHLSPAEQADGLTDWLAGWTPFMYVYTDTSAWVDVWTDGRTDSGNMPPSLPTTCRSNYPTLPSIPQSKMKPSRGIGAHLDQI